MISETETYWKTPIASLTSIGASTMSSQGKKLNAQLSDFFKEKTFNVETTKIISSNLNRTVLSAYYFMKGIFNIATKLDSIETEVNACEYLNQFYFIRKPMKCDILLRYFNTGLSHTIHENILSQNKKHKELKTGFEIISKVLPLLPDEHSMTMKTLNYHKLFYFYDYLKIYVSHDLPIPYGFPKELYEELEFTEELIPELINGAPSSLRIANYPLSLEIIDSLKNDKNIFTYISAHDLNMSAFLRLFNFKVKSFPFGSHWVLSYYDDGHSFLW